MAKTPNSYGSFRLWPAILVGASCLHPPDARTIFFRVTYYKTLQFHTDKVEIPRRCAFGTIL